MSQKVLELSVIIITLNEEANLGRCLKSLPSGCEIIVLDSGSTDQTEAIAQTFGATFRCRKFDHYSAQKNAASDLATRRWVFSIDADEELNVVARDAIAEVVSRPIDVRFSAYRVKRQLVFLGRLMRFGKTSDAPVRLFLRGSAQFSEPIHERLDVTTTKVGPALPGILRHHSYKDLTDYFAKFNSYTSKIAVNHYQKKLPLPHLIKHYSRPALEFISRYIFRLGFLDGHAGFSYALFSSVYAYVKYDKLWRMYQAETKIE
jgi:glycosyltransferase involved in cell wall biosynthesis